MNSKKTTQSSVTRGSGLLEGFLAKKRAGKANEFITEKHRKGKILDVGCGTYPFFLESTEFAEKYGIDPNVNFSSIKNKKIKLKKMNLKKNKFPFKNDFFDAIVMLAVFEHLEYENIPYILDEINRILKKDGVFVITTPAPWSDKLLHLTARSGLISSEEIHDHKHNHPNAKIVSLIERAKFKKNKIKSGYFEMGFNMWFAAKK